MRRKRSLGLTSSSPNKLPIQEDIKEEFEVEQILAHRFEVSGQRSYKIKWLGYPDEENTWVPEDDIFARVLLSNYCRNANISLPSKPLFQTEFGESESNSCFWRALEDLGCLLPSQIPKGNGPVGFSEVQIILSSLGFTLKKVPKTERENLRRFPIIAFEQSLQLGHALGFPEGTRSLPVGVFRAYYLITNPKEINKHN
jgi:hypothetical protein